MESCARHAHETQDKTHCYRIMQREELREKEIEIFLTIICYNNIAGGSNNFNIKE